MDWLATKTCRGDLAEVSMMLLHLHNSGSCICSSPNAEPEGLLCIVHELDFHVSLAAMHGSDNSSNVQGQRNDTSSNLLTTSGKRVPGLDVLQRRRDWSPGISR